MPQSFEITAGARASIQLGTVGALVAELCIRHDLLLLTTDGDFVSAAKHCDLKVWKSGL
jgi:predicted nucleic acid-binding protein